MLRSAAILALLAAYAGCSNEELAGDEVAQAGLALDELRTTTAVSAVSVGVGGGGTGGGGTGGAGGEPGGGPAAVGFWKLDDCSASATDLVDSSGNDATASRAAGAGCATGIDGLAVAFDERSDIITIPDQPLFTFGQNLAVAAWVKPTTVSGVHSIVQERSSGQTSFALGIRNGNAQFTVTLNDGRSVTSRAPIAANVWTHVAGVYDGRFTFLFLNGEQVGQISAVGRLGDVEAPIRIGNTPQRERVQGLIDEVWLSAAPVAPFDIAQLSCIRRPGTLTVVPSTTGAVPPNTPVRYDITVTNNDVGSCPPGDFLLQLPGTPPGLGVVTDLTFFPGVRPGQSVDFAVTVTGTEDADPGVHLVPFELLDFTSPRLLSGELTFELAEPTGCFVRTGRELFIKHLSVVEDPVRTTSDGPPEDPRTGVWTFARLMEDMAPTPADAPALVERLLNTWLTDQVVNGFTIPARPTLREFVLDSWPRSPDGSLDLKRAPLRLLSIVNRMDVRNLAEGHAGEGRFVFGFLDQTGFEMPFTLILEYRLPASTEADVLDWANAWHGLGSLPVPSEEYNAALQAITTRFAGRNAAPGRPNGSSLGQLRTNEIALFSPWELREFTLSPVDGFLRPDTVKLTPDSSLNGTPAIADYVNQNEDALLVERHTVPDVFQGAPFLGGGSLNILDTWVAPGIANNEARHKFSLNTCNGCHGTADTGTDFLHVFPRPQGVEANLSGFLTGISVPDPVTGERRVFNDLARRNQDLRALVCGAEPAPAPSAATSGSALDASRSAFIRRGIGRVH